MDRFKFRAWNYKTNSIMDDYELRDYSLRSLQGLGDLSIKLEQCTGLKDKNGKLIYEGDIVRHTEHPVYFEGTNHEVYFDDELCEFGLRCTTVLFHNQFRNEFEVIGNIHENPELLEV